MELTEERVREIVREELERCRKEEIDSFRRALEGWAKPSPTPRGMTRTEAQLLREMGLDPFEEAEKPRPEWMDCWQAAELRAAGIDPFSVIKDEVMGVLKELNDLACKTSS